MGNMIQSLPAPAQFGQFLNAVDFYTPEEVEQFRELLAQQKVFDAREKQWNRPAFQAKHKELQEAYRRDPSDENFQALNGMPREMMEKHFEEMNSANYYANAQYLRDEARGLYEILLGRAREMAEAEAASLRSKFRDTFAAYGVSYSDPIVVGALLSFAQRVSQQLERYQQTGNLPKPNQLLGDYLPDLPPDHG